MKKTPSNLVIPTEDVGKTNGECVLAQHLPNFGQFKKEREKRLATFKKEKDLLDEEHLPSPIRPANQPAGPIPAIRALVAAAVDRIGSYGDLNNKQQVVALIDEVRGLSQFKRWFGSFLLPHRAPSPRSENRFRYFN